MSINCNTYCTGESYSDKQTNQESMYSPPYSKQHIYSISPSSSCINSCDSSQWVACLGPASAVCLHPWWSAVCEPGPGITVCSQLGRNKLRCCDVFITRGWAKLFPSPDKIALPVHVLVFVMGLMWCGWHSRASGPTPFICSHVPT